MTQIGNKQVGPGHPTYVIGEIGINHNGDLDVALELGNLDLSGLDGFCDLAQSSSPSPIGRVHGSRMVGVPGSGLVRPGTWDG